MQIRNQTPLQWLLALALFFVLFNSWAANSVVPQAVPDWVSTVNVPKINPALVEQSKNGVHYLLADRQVKVSEDQPPAYFHHYADYIVNQTGVEYSSQINIDYDPHYQQVALHSLKIIRDKLVIDKLNTARISTFQREKELEKLIYNGTETINIIIDDVRVGDIIEYSFTRSGMNPAYQNIFAYRSAINWSVPVGKLSLKLFWGKSTPLLHELRNSNLNIQQTSTSQGQEFSLEVTDIAGVEREPNIPSWYSPSSQVYFSELSSWQQVNEWAGQYYQDALISDSNLQSLTQQIKQQNPDLKSQISAALQFVQDEVRYLGIELNDSSHIPTPAIETLNNRYGDCKDKTVLLIAILKSLGLKAYPALVNTEDDLSQVLPNVKAFDHVITYFEYQDKQYWVDPTSSFQHGNLDSIYQPNFGYALVLGNTVKTLVAMPSQTAPHAEFVIDNFDIPEQGPISFTSTT